MENRQNSKEMIEKLCADTWRELYRFIYYRVQNREEAEDITQETYARAISYLNRTDTRILEYSSYLKTIAVNIIRDQWRAKQRRGDSVNLEDVRPEEIAQEDFSGSLSDRAQIKEAIGQLGKEQQTVIDLRIIKGYSVKETARLMRKKEGTVRVLQFRAVQALTKLLEAEDGMR
ncbi:MAG TPA: sigma-70 family RNA polymerase sigma factor [Clostridiales bacterium]|nr:sigma-70 family RNA polymerase sigma factor [Clostridiales bacterium]